MNESNKTVNNSAPNVSSDIMNELYDDIRSGRASGPVQVDDVIDASEMDEVKTTPNLHTTYNFDDTGNNSDNFDDTENISVGNSTSTFNASEFAPLLGDFKLAHKKFSQCLMNIAMHAGWAADAYRSEDSDLSNAFNNIDTTLSTARTKIDSTMTRIEEAMRQYMEETIANEEETRKSIINDNNIIEEIANIINSI